VLFALHTPGVLYRCEFKELAGKGICKAMKTKGGSRRAALTKLQLSRERRVCKLLIPQVSDFGLYPPRVFWQKSVDLLDCKGLDVFRDDK
jgi:hypothetical protein